MPESICDKVIKTLNQAGYHNSHVMVKPEVILWPDPENQWTEVIGILQEKLPCLLVYGSYDPSKRQGPAIWLKCMIARTLPDATWSDEDIPIIYLPGVAKSDLRNVENAGLNLQPLLEYQYTGTVLLQENGREWSILAFVENPTSGLGLKVAKDNPTREAFKKVLPSIFQDREALANKSIIDADYLNQQLFPDILPSILKWMCKGDVYLQSLNNCEKSAFYNLCRSHYEFEPDYKNIKAIAEKLGSQKNSWNQVWQLYATAPHKYPEIEDLLRLSKPSDLGVGVFALPEESWPQVNEEKEDALSKALTKVVKQDASKALEILLKLEKEHGSRRSWVWSELGRSPLAHALKYLTEMAEISSEAYSSSSIDEIKAYYIDRGLKIDQCMRKALVVVKTGKDKSLVSSVIQLFYKPWLENITRKFQKLIEQDATIFTSQKADIESETYLLFVDAFRYELADEFSKRLVKQKLNVSLQTTWSAIPSLTPTAKPNVSPIAGMVAISSDIKEFRPHLQNGKDLLTPAFREAIQKAGYRLVTQPGDIHPEGRYWQEIGDIDTKGHEEQADMVKRVEELFEKIQETIEVAFEKGIKRIKIITDHGWLLLPGGLPKTEFNAELTETRWGRCALIKDDASSDLFHLPWRWNPSIFIAYAPGISFFKANQEYAHGGISLHECLIPVMIVENPNQKKIEAKLLDIKWVNLKCTVQTSKVPDGYAVDIRTKYNDEESTVVASKNRLLKGNSVTLMANDLKEYESATVVLLDDRGIILDKKPTTVGGD